MIRGGKSLVSASPAFSNDASKLLLCSGTTVSIFSIATALQVGELEGHLALVTSVIVEPAATTGSIQLCFCWTASLDGTIRYWDFASPELLKTVDVKLPIFSMVIPRFLRQQTEKDEKQSQLYAYISVEDIEGIGKPHKTSRGQVLRCNLTKPLLIRALTLAETPTPEFITISPSGKFFAVLSKQKILVWETSSKESDYTALKKLKLHHTRKFTAVAFHGSERIIAAGRLPFKSSVAKEGSSGQYAFSSLVGILAIKAENYCVQLFSLLDDRASSEVQVCERNHLPDDDVTVMVSLIALSLDGVLMCTVEERLPEEDIGGLICSKFWSREDLHAEFSLQTVIYEPHRDAGISAIAFHPALPMAVSSSFGGDFKTWASTPKRNLNDKASQKVGWTCHAVGSYKNKPMTAASFSPDGSVLSVAAETVITLWNPLQNVLVAVIGETFEPIATLSFTGNSEFIVSTSCDSRPQFCVWSLSKLSLAWSYELCVEALTCAEDGSFAILAIQTKPEESKVKEGLQGRDGVILIFNAGDPTPVSAWSVLKANGGSISFVKRNRDVMKDGSQDVTNSNELLAYVNGGHEYVLFDHNNSAASIQSFNRSFPYSLQETGQSGYASMYGELPEIPLTKTSEVPQAPLALSTKSWETIFSGLTHTLPSLVKLCPIFLESLLEKRSATAK